VGTGRFQVYTGNGKGKTTALLGLSVRAACSGMGVFIAQFMKGQEYSELCLPRRFPEITIRQFGGQAFINPGEKPSPDDLKNALMAAEATGEAMHSGKFGLVGADEICVAVHMGVLQEEVAIELIGSRPGSVELVFTGRYATDRILEKADLVTEMLEIKHYYNTEGLSARRGIEN